MPSRAHHCLGQVWRGPRAQRTPGTPLGRHRLDGRHNDCHEPQNSPLRQAEPCRAIVTGIEAVAPRGTGHRSRTRLPTTRVRHPPGPARQPRQPADRPQRIIAQAGLKLWPKLYVNLRASRATELVEHYPGHVAADWLGHTEAIADEHYRQTTTEHYTRAAAEPTGSTERTMRVTPAGQNP